ncbi:putative bifunctional diguanylate cyclase/phosphodiesterase [Qipengyuania sp.]|uniref:putative bifunctional diguanylate cyclase/phosphodiesterase n=1 Tax=Qipengyuania sp. TaxID=2004515 RepID=UPI0035C7ED48
MGLLKEFDGMIGLHTDNPVADKFSRERVRSIRRFIGFYYLAIIAPFAAVAVDHPDHVATWFMAAVIVLAILFRFRHWFFPAPSEKSEDTSASAARITAAVAIGLTLSQLIFYAALSSQNAEPSRHGLFIVAVGVVAGLTQATALTGVIFAARVIYVGLLAPLLLCIPFVLPLGGMPVAIAFMVLCAISFRLAEASHVTQLNLFGAQFETEDARHRAEEVNEELQRARLEAQSRADTDSLTGLRNRFAFLRDIRSRMERGRAGVLMLIDLDRFKPINDLYGHYAGDIALRFVARRLKRALPAQAIIGRLGGDEFGVYIEFDDALTSRQKVLLLCDAALARSRRPMRISKASMRMGASGGARVIGTELRSVEDALRDADYALYTAKKAGMDTLRLFDDDIRDEALRTASVEAALLALDPETALSLVYQPIVRLDSGELTCFEALARWHDPVLGTVPPMEFIPLAEQKGRIEEFTLVLLRKALHFARTWGGKCELSFNLSAAHICSAGAAAVLVEVVRESGFPADHLQFEITETAMLVNFEAARENVQQLRDAGCRIALDDFGAGFASLVHLREIRFDKVKIDGSLTRAAHTQQGRDMLRGVITMIDAMKLEAVLEYVATCEDLDIARELGAAFGQGFYLGAPYNEDGVLAVLRQCRKAYRRPQGCEDEWGGKALRLSA